jgi:hypothetical protein
MMMKKLLMFGLVWLLLTGICSAQSLELTLDAGSKSIYAGGDYRIEVDNGYMKAGIAGLYTDDDDTEYKWGIVKLVAGNDTMVQGLQCEVGLKGILGNSEDDGYSGDVGALAFTLYGGYTFPHNLVPIPIEIFSQLTYAPEPLSFQDTKLFTEMSLGVGVHIIKNAAVTLTYTSYDIDMENGPGNWTLDKDVLRAGVVMRF